MSTSAQIERQCENRLMLTYLRAVNNTSSIASSNPPVTNIPPRLFDTNYILPVPVLWVWWEHDRIWHDSRKGDNIFCTYPNAHEKRKSLELQSMQTSTIRVISFDIDQCYSRSYLLDHPEVKAGIITCKVSDLCWSKPFITGSAPTFQPSAQHV